MNAQTLAMLRRVTAGFLTETCTLDREAATRGRYGEPTHDREVIGTDVPCRLILVGQRYGSGVAEAAGAETMRDEYRLIVGRDVALAPDLRVTVNGLTYDVVRIETALTDAAFHAAVLARRA